MPWTGQIFAYCERGREVGFWAEPLNAATNAAFLAAGLATLVAWCRRRPEERGRFELALIGLLFAIGAGSFLFHTTAMRWAALADTIPIGVFMVAYLVYALRRFVGLSRVATALATLTFVATLPPAGMIRCGGGPCLNGSVGYLPAFAALVVVGSLLRASGHAAARTVLLAGMVFAVSLIFRSIDRAVCIDTAIGGGQLAGTHFVWHLLNGLLLYLLVAAALQHSRRSPSALEPPHRQGH